MKLLKTAAAIALLSTSVLASATSYKIDPGHSTVQFSIEHFGFSELIGRFNQFEGQFNVDEANPSNNSATLTVKIESIDTNHEKRDVHLRSPDFFDAKQNTEMVFESTSFDGTTENGTLKGNLSMMGKTLPVSFSLEKVGEGDDPWGGHRAGFVAKTVIDRTDYGISYMVPNIPAEVEITIFIEGIKQ